MLAPSCELPLTLRASSARVVPTVPANEVVPVVVTVRSRAGPAALSTLPVKATAPLPLAMARSVGSVRLPAMIVPVLSLRPRVRVGTPAKVSIRPCDTCSVPAPPPMPIEPAASFAAIRTLPAPLPVAGPTTVRESLRTVSAWVPMSSVLPSATAAAETVASAPTVTGPASDTLPLAVTLAFSWVAPATLRLPSAAVPPIAPPTAPPKVVVPPVVTPRLRPWPAALATVPVKPTSPELLSTERLRRQHQVAEGQVAGAVGPADGDAGEAGEAVERRLADLVGAGAAGDADGRALRQGRQGGVAAAAHRAGEVQHIGTQAEVERAGDDAVAEAEARADEVGGVAERHRVRVELGAGRGHAGRERALAGDRELRTRWRSPRGADRVGGRVAAGQAEVVAGGVDALRAGRSCRRRRRGWRAVRATGPV